MFIPGRELSRGFFAEAAAPILAAHFPSLRYTAGLLGYGSDVLGYDDEISTDHMWGPRFYLFLKPEDMNLVPELTRVFSEHLPRSYRGYSVHFSMPETPGVMRAMADPGEGPIHPLIFFDTIDSFLERQIGTAKTDEIDPAHWLSVAEQRLLSLTRADLYRDDLGLKDRLAPLRYYPPEVRLYLIASNWSIIASEQAFSGRCAMRHDEYGARIICARIVERLMRLGFLYSGEYAPYAKWFGTAFQRLPVPEEYKEALRQALCAENSIARESALVRAQVLAGEMHNQSGLTEAVPIRVQNYYDREIKVIFAEQFAESTAKAQLGTALEGVPLFGAISDFGGLCEAADRPEALQKLKGLYQKQDADKLLFH